MRRRPPRLLTAALALVLVVGGTACTPDGRRPAATGPAPTPASGEEVALRLV